VTNDQGRLTDDGLVRTIEAARAAGIRALDTAPAYGDAESRLAPWASEFAITTKVLGAGERPIADQFKASLMSLGVSSLHGCLLHDWPSLTKPQAAAAVRELRALQEAEQVTAVGVSAYDDDDLARAIDAFGTVDVVQVPVNALDRRLTRSRALATIAEQGAQIQARSVFLQGLLAARSTTPLGQHPDVVHFHDGCEEAGSNPIEVALGFVKAQPWVTHVVVGVTSAAELREISEAWGSAPAIDAAAGEESHDLALIDPRQWA
jgi:aryl-alcohol dehydrogenase-like predicted oxidoreductase